MHAHACLRACVRAWQHACQAKAGRSRQMLSCAAMAAFPAAPSVPRKCTVRTRYIVCATYAKYAAHTICTTYTACTAKSRYTRHHVIGCHTVSCLFMPVFTSLNQPIFNCTNLPVWSFSTVYQLIPFDSVSPNSYSFMQFYIALYHICHVCHVRHHGRYHARRHVRPWKAPGRHRAGAG